MNKPDFETFVNGLNVMTDEEEKAYNDKIISEGRHRLAQSFEDTLPMRYKKTSLATYKTQGIENAEKALDICKAQNKNGSNVILYGAYGNGKTHLAYGMLRRAFMDKKKVMYFTQKSLVRWLRERESWKSDKAIEELVKLDLIAIEELGRTTGTQSEKSDIFEIIDRRYGAMKPTILTSNLRGDDLHNELGSGLISRLTGDTSSLVFCDWDDYRQNKA